MLSIVGVREKSFTFDNDGKKRVVHGFQVFCTDDSNSKVEGLSTLDFFLSDSVLDRSSFVPRVGSSIEAVLYNRFGRIDRVILPSK